MKENEIDFLAGEALQYYRDIVEMSGDTVERMPEEISGREILDWIYPKVMWTDGDRETDGPMAFIIECDCEWEPEHGLEIWERRSSRLYRAAENSRFTMATETCSADMLFLSM